MKIVKLTMLENRGIAAPVIRSYTTKLKKEHTDIFAKATDQGRRITADRISKVTANVFGPSSRHKHVAHIDGGWDEKRIMFAMVVEMASRSRSKTYNYIVGYTDHSGHSLIGRKVKFDRKMRLYFNTITQIHMIESEWRGSSIWQPRMQRHDQILNRTGISGFGRTENRGDNRPVTTRPTDLFRRGGSDKSFGAMLKSDGGTTNLTGVFSGILRASSRLNNSPTSMLTRSLQALAGAGANPNDAYMGDADDAETLEAAQDKVEETIITEDPLMEQLKKESNIISSGYITFGELMDMNPDFDEDRQLGFNLYKPARDEFQSNASFNEDTNETIAATIIANHLPTIMIGSMYSKVADLVLRSNPRPGDPVVESAHPYPFVDGMDIDASFPYFEDQITHVMINEVTNGGVFDVIAHIDANIDTEINIRIRIDGGEEARYTFPAYADGLLAPTMDNSLKSLGILSKGVIDLAAGLHEARLDASPNHTKTPNILTSSDVAGARDDRDRRSSRDETRSRDDRSGNRSRGKSII
jgi:hypothetical protein